MLRIFSEDGIWLPMWWGSKNWLHMQCSHPVECICPCTLAYTEWPTECSAEGHYNNTATIEYIEELIGFIVEWITSVKTTFKISQLWSYKENGLWSTQVCGRSPYQMTGNTKKETADCPACFPWGKKEYTHQQITRQKQWNNNKKERKKQPKVKRNRLVWKKVQNGGIKWKNMISHSPFTLCLLDTTSWQKVISLDIVLLLCSSMFSSQPGLFCCCPVMRYHRHRTPPGLFCSCPVMRYHRHRTQPGLFSCCPVMRYHRHRPQPGLFCWCPVMRYHRHRTPPGLFCSCSVMRYHRHRTLPGLFVVVAQSWDTTDTETEIISAENPKLSNVLSVPFRH